MRLCLHWPPTQAVFTLARAEIMPANFIFDVCARSESWVGEQIHGDRSMMVGLTEY